MAGIWIFAERQEQALELLSAGKELAKSFGTELCAFAVEDADAQAYLAHGADSILKLAPLADGQPLEACVPVIADAARDKDPDVFLFAATPRGKEIAARVAARLGAALCSECTGYAVGADKSLTMERMVYGGLAVQTVASASRPQMATVPPKTFEPAPEREAGQGGIKELPAAPESAMKVVARTPHAHQTVDIGKAEVVVCVGRGMGKEEDVAMARELAEVLGGEVACSRPVAEELGWLPEEVYLGISGKKVKPRLYVGLGVSGQIQHVSGVRDSKVILAVNKDENAPIFEAADYGIVGDLYEALPKLTRALKSALNK